MQVVVKVVGVVGSEKLVGVGWVPCIICESNWYGDCDAFTSLRSPLKTLCSGQAAMTTI